MKIKDQPISKQFIMLTLKENKPGEPLLLHEEPIYLNDNIVEEQHQEISLFALIKI